MLESTLSAQCLQSIPILLYYNTICSPSGETSKLWFDLPPCRMMTKHGYTEPSHTSDVSFFSSKCHHCHQCRHFTVVYFVVKCLMRNNWPPDVSGCQIWRWCVCMLQHGIFVNVHIAVIVNCNLFTNCNSFSLWQYCSYNLHVNKAPCTTVWKNH